MMFGKNRGAAAVAARIPQGSIGLEIGVWKGDSSELFLHKASHLHLVDPWSVTAYEKSKEFGGFNEYLKRYSQLVGRPDKKAFQDYYDTVYGSVVKRFEGRPVTIHRCTSEKFFMNFKDTVDWAYIDGSHSEEGCYHDLLGCLRIVNWRIFGDDYGTKEGVTNAVDRVVKELGVKLEVFGGDQYQLS